MRRSWRMGRLWLVRRRVSGRRSRSGVRNGLLRAPCGRRCARRRSGGHRDAWDWRRLGLCPAAGYDLPVDGVSDVPVVVLRASLGRRRCPAAAFRDAALVGEGLLLREVGDLVGAGGGRPDRAVVVDQVTSRVACLRRWRRGWRVRWRWRRGRSGGRRRRRRLRGRGARCRSRSGSRSRTGSGRWRGRSRRRRGRRAGRSGNRSRDCCGDRRLEVWRRLRQTPWGVCVN